MSGSSSDRCRQVLSTLSGFGTPDWWKGDTEEVMIGALLIQQTRWENVEKALVRLKKDGICTLDGIIGADAEVLEEAIRCAGFFRVKAKRLRALADHVTGRSGGIEGMRQESTPALLRELLGISGIGRETAESILCYGFGRKIFVMDAYTRHICGCAGIEGERTDLQARIAVEIQGSPESFRTAHAAFVEYGRNFCRQKRCSECRIAELRNSESGSSQNGW